MPGLISTHGRNGNISFLDDGHLCVFTTDETGTRFTHLKDGHWTTPQQVPWGFTRGIDDYTLGGDGKTFYWQSGKLTDQNDTVKDINIWKSEWTGVEWKTPTPLPGTVNHPEFDEIYPTATADGSVYYFCSNRPDSRGADIYFNRCEKGEYSATERLPWPINSEYNELDFIVAPDDRYLIFASNRPGGYGQCDNYICFRREDGSWTHPINMGDRVNSYGNEMRSFVSHDGRYFFFGSTREAAAPKGDRFVSELATRYGDNDVYWIDASILSKLRDTMRMKQCAAKRIREELHDNGTQSAIARLRELLASGQEHYYFSLFELLDICEHLIKDGNAEDAATFYIALLDAFDAFRVQHGYALILAKHGDVEEAVSLLEKLEDAGDAIDLATTLDFLYYDLKRKGETEDAIYVMQRKIERFPDSYFAYCYLATLYERLGDTEKAIAACEKAIALNRDFSDAKEILERLISAIPSDRASMY